MKRTIPPTFLMKISLNRSVESSCQQGDEHTPHSYQFIMMHFSTPRPYLSYTTICNTAHSTTHCALLQHTQHHTGFSRNLMSWSWSTPCGDEAHHFIPPTPTSLPHRLHTLRHPPNIHSHTVPLLLPICSCSTQYIFMVVGGTCDCTQLTVEQKFIFKKPHITTSLYQCIVHYSPRVTLYYYRFNPI